MANTVYTPGVGGTPFGNQNTNSQGANYPNDSAYSPEELNLIQKEIRYKIFDAAPAQFDALKLIFSKEVKEKNLDEFEYLEKTFGRSPMEAIAGTQTSAAAAATPAVPGTFVSHTFNVSSASLLSIAVSDVITYPGGQEGVIADITGNIVTVRSRTNAGLPGIVVGNVFAIRSTIYADGQTGFDHYSRMDVVTRYNYIQLFLRAQRWGEMERQKYINAGTTDYMDLDKKEKLKQIRIDMFVSCFNGFRGEYTLSGARVAKSMGGIYPTMVAAGSANANPTLGGLAAAFENLAFNTNFKAEGATRYIYGTHAVLHELSKTYKLSSVRLQTGEKKVNLDLNQIELGGSKYVLVPCELFREPSCFPATWARKLLVLDQDTINPVKMKGLPLLQMNQTDDVTKGTREFFTDWSVRGQMSLEFDNPIGSFWIDVQ